MHKKGKVNEINDLWYFLDCTYSESNFAESHFDSIIDDSVFPEDIFFCAKVIHWYLRDFLPCGWYGFCKFC